MVVACLSVTSAEILERGVQCQAAVIADSVGEVHMKYCQCGWGTHELLSVWVRSTGGAFSVCDVHRRCFQCG